jgi:hypothetical protein
MIYNSNYLEKTLDAGARVFVSGLAYGEDIGHFDSLSIGAKKKVLVNAEKMLGANDDKISDVAIAFYEKLGLENCANHLIEDCFNTRNLKKRNLAFRLFMDNPTNDEEVLDSLIYGLNNDKTRSMSSDILNAYKKSGINIH